MTAATTESDWPDPSLELEAVVDDFTARCRQGRVPEIEHYARRYPHFAAELRDLLASVAMIEGLKQQVATADADGPEGSSDAGLSELGDYHLVRELGRGGMGVVYEAIHQSLGRRVALKVLSPRWSADPRSVQRFRREASAAARLHHTHLVTVFGVGFSQGRHYYVMEFVDGCSAAQLLKRLQPPPTPSTKSAVDAAPWPWPTTEPQASTRVDSQLPAGRGPSDPSVGHGLGDAAGTGMPDLSAAGSAPSLTAFPVGPTLSDPVVRIRWALESIAGIADAVAYAHQQGVLHRDLKPGNVLVDAAGQVRLTDFGLVKQLDEPGLTCTGDLVGTPQYMPPESLDGEYDVRSEVYGLGLTLYELLALRPVIPQGSATSWSLARTGREAPALRSVLPQASRDLERVLQKALAMAPGERYSTVAAFRDDLRCLLDDRAISIRRRWLAEEVWRWARRDPTSAALAGSCVLLLVMVAVSTTLGYTLTQQAYRELSQQHERLRWQQAQTETARQLAVDNQRRMADEYQRAEANLQVSMDAMDAMFVQIIAKGQQPSSLGSRGQTLALDWDGLNELAGVQTAITADDAQFLTDMLRFYHQIAEQNAESLELQLQSGRAYRRVANSYYLIGDWPRAIRAYEEASRLFQSLLQEEPSSESLLLVLAQIHNEAGQAVRRHGDQAGAIRQHQEAIRVLQESPLADRPAVRLEVARSLNLLCTADTGIVGDVQRLPPSVIEDYFGLQRSRRSAFGNSSARVTTRRTETLTRRQRDWLEQAIEITDQLLQVEPENADVRLVRAKSYRGLAVLLDPTAQPAEFKQLIDDAIEQIEQLQTKDPANPQFAYSLALTYTIPGMLDDAASTEYLPKASKLTRTLCAESPQNMEFHQLNSNIHVEWAKLLFELEQDDEGIEALYAAAASLSHLVKTAPTLAYYRWEYANVSMALSKKLLEKNMGRRASGVLEQAIADGRAAEERVPLRGRLRALDIQQHQVLAEIYQATNNRTALQRVNRELRRLRTPAG